ncbi:hypothetical protein PVK06_003972 [Gossypium arboreum]|uniref:Uncharacterized protein n=1 Tax=Gossypium arboreum TaxID=29729 RepID=A0ABR0QQQ5_GOSAR|nr:hypothetical protein PVK06_003972 [Gossypium arboreum]
MSFGPVENDLKGIIKIKNKEQGAFGGIDLVVRGVDRFKQQHLMKLNEGVLSFVAAFKRGPDSVSKDTTQW